MEDVVLKLYQNGLSNIVEEIFSYLDWREIKNATEVSSTWRDILMESEVEVWKSREESRDVHGSDRQICRIGSDWIRSDPTNRC